MSPETRLNGRRSSKEQVRGQFQDILFAANGSQPGSPIAKRGGMSFKGMLSAPQSLSQPGTPISKRGGRDHDIRLDVAEPPLDEDAKSRMPWRSGSGRGAAGAKRLSSAGRRKLPGDASSSADASLSPTDAQTPSRSRRTMPPALIVTNGSFKLQSCPMPASEDEARARAGSGSDIQGELVFSSPVDTDQALEHVSDEAAGVAVGPVTCSNLNPRASAAVLIGKDEPGPEQAKGVSGDRILPVHARDASDAFKWIDP